MTLIGHSPQRTALANLVQEDRLPGSLIFTGPAGTGKKLAALELAKQLLCQSPSPCPQGGCGGCRPCSLFESGTHPDLHLMDFGVESASTDDLRHTLDRLSLKAFMGTRRVTILNDVDMIPLVGANVILKTLEEPRPDTYFILIASTPSRLPQTIVSRCQKWFFDRLSSQEIQEILKARGASEEEIALAPLADGSLSALEGLSTQQSMLDEVLGAINAAWRGEATKNMRYAQEWGGDKSGMRARLALLRTSLRQKLFEYSSQTISAAVWAHALQNALDAEYLILERHANPTAVIFNVLQSCAQHHGARLQKTPHAESPIIDQLIG